MEERVVYREGDQVVVEFVADATGDNIAIVPFAVASDGSSEIYLAAAACTMMHPGSDDREKEIYLGLFTTEPHKLHVEDRDIGFAQEKLSREGWKGFCVAASLALRGIVTLEKPVRFLIYTDLSWDQKRVELLMVQARHTCSDAGYDLRAVDAYLGKTLWVAVRKDQDEVER